MFFFFNDTATTEIYTLSLHDALPISIHPMAAASRLRTTRAVCCSVGTGVTCPPPGKAASVLMDAEAMHGTVPSTCPACMHCTDGSPAFTVATLVMVAGAGRSEERRVGK